MTTLGQAGLNVDTRVQDGRTVVSVAGELDVYTCARLRDELARLSAEGRHHLALDLRELEFTDSSGLGVLVGAVKRAKAGGGGLALVGVRESILRVLRITGLVKVMPPFELLAEALDWLDT